MNGLTGKEFFRIFCKKNFKNVSGQKKNFDKRFWTNFFFFFCFLGPFSYDPRLQKAGKVTKIDPSDLTPRDPVDLPKPPPQDYTQRDMEEFRVHMFISMRVLNRKEEAEWCSLSGIEF